MPANAGGTGNGRCTQLEPCLDQDALNALTWHGSPRDLASHLTLELTHDELVSALNTLRPC